MADVRFRGMYYLMTASDLDLRLSIVSNACRNTSHKNAQSSVSFAACSSNKLLESSSTIVATACHEILIPENLTLHKLTRVSLWYRSEKIWSSHDMISRVIRVQVASAQLIIYFPKVHID